MNKIGSTCKDCTFNNGDLGCDFGIIENIKKESTICKVVDGDYQFDRICAYRTTENKTKEEVQRERYTRFHFIVVDSDLEKTKKHIEYIRTFITSKSNLHVATKKNFSDLVKILPTKKNFRVFHLFEDDFDVYQTIDSAFKKIPNGYTVVIRSEDEFSRDMLSSFDKFINVKMKRVGLINSSPFIINNMLYKYLKGNKIDYFSDKLHSCQNEESEYINFVYNWEQVND